MNLHCDWPVELLRWLMGWAGYLQKVPDTLTKLSFLWEQWKLTSCSGPLYIIFFFFLFVFWSEEQYHLDFGSDSYIKNAQEQFASWNLSNTSLACF